ncbi:histidinol-phosphatase HisJ family protein [Priestia megaterium]|nr:histidinol-phosphatase HisJ family protein [Priestia megaterium]
MYLMDYHHHTNHSFDSKAVMKEVCATAIEKNVKEICFTEHFSLNPMAPTYGHINLKAYLADIKSCQEMFMDQLTIKAGIEICEPHLLKDGYQEVLDPLNLDFVLGSVHNIDNQKLRKYLAGKEQDALYRGYFEELYKLVCTADIDVLAHIDLMKRYAIADYGNYQFEDFKELLTEILMKAIERNIGIEINTSGNRSKINEPLPSIHVLKLYKELGGELLTLGSDSHFAHSVGAHIPEAMQIAKQIGFTYIFKYEKRNPIPVKL